jgi:hypothetical protein
MNAALALIEAAKPQSEIEGALAVQIACAHSAAASVLARFRGGGGSERRVVALAAAARLLRAYSTQVEAHRRLHHRGDQYVRVEHVHINDGPQAVIGNVQRATRRPPHICLHDHQSRGMAERSSQQAQQARDELRRVAGFSVVDEIEKLDRLKKSGSITDQEFTRLRAKLVA